MAAITLVEAAKAALNNGEFQRAGVIRTFAEKNDILRVMPFSDISGNAIKYNREAALPSTAFRGVNQSYTASNGTIEPQVESLMIAGGDLDVDRYLVRTMGEGVRTAQELMKVSSLAQSVGHKMIKGSVATSNLEFDGLQIRCSSAQLVANGATSGGDVLSMIKLDEAIDKVDGPTHLLMSKATRRTITAAARTTTVGGFITHTKDEFGRQIAMYNDLPILIADNNDDLNASLAFDETNPGGGSSVGTSIYVLSLGEGRLWGIQSEPISVRDLGELDASPVFRSRVEWYVSLVMAHPRAASRLWGIKAGVAVA